MKSIFHDYINKNQKALSLFPYQPDMQGIKERINEIQHKKASKELCTYLQKYNKYLNCSEQTLQNIDKLQKGAKVVITGQQCGLLGGPLYTIYKALTAVKLAEKITMETDTVTVPVFWVADEDHDWQEINHTYFLDDSGTPAKFKLDYDVKDTPAYEVTTTKETLEELLRFMESSGLKTENFSEVVDQINRTYDQNFSNWFAKIVTSILYDTGIVIVDSKAPIIKEQGKPIFQKMITNRDLLIKDLSITSSIIENLGYDLQNRFDIDEETNLFIIKDKSRYKLKKQGQGFSSKTGEDYTLDEVVSHINQGEVSPNVFLRPIIQDISFPTVAYVGGPGEVNYLAQISQLYSSLTENKLPVIYPRQSFMAIEPAVKKILKRYTLNYPHIHNLSEFKEGVIHNKQWTAINKEFITVRNDIIHQHNQLIDKISTINPQLSTLGDKNLQLILSQIEFLNKKAFKFHKENNELVIKHVEKVENSCLPNSTPQERNINIFYYFLKYSHWYLDKIVESIDLENFELQYIEI